ncbi:MAG: GAF domain-containing sensor histidine kinase [Chloroflexi bacterium]|nr:GAF domain-containing sensor histidine kinase [Chloroflexota bacterium]MBV9547070.1 GAF domain-containing sensor histidine kinase [Chloroflexota bacterium]
MLSPAAGVASSGSVAQNAPTKPPIARETPESRAFSDTESFRWVRRAVAITIPVLGVVTISTAYADTMPIFHHAAAWIAVAIMTAAWAVELAGVPWSRIALIAAVVLPNAWLTSIGHDALNYMYLWLLVAWVSFAGTRVEGILALGLTLGTVAFDSVLVAVSGGQLNWGLMAGTSFLLLIVWFMGLSLRREHQRSQELATLLTVSRSVASPLEMNALLDAIFDALATVLDYSAIAVLTLNETRDMLTFAHMRAPSSHRALELRRTQYAVTDLGPAWGRLCNDEPVLISDVNKTAPEVGLAHAMTVDDDANVQHGIVRSLMWIPLVVHERVVGILSISSATANAFGTRDTTLALGIARQAAVAIDNARLHERARQAAVLEERQRLSRELHDSVTQALYGISLYAEAACRSLTGGSTEPAIANLQEIRDTAHEALGEMRLLLFELRPPVLQEQGLAAALRARVQAVETRAGVVAEFACEGDQRLAPDKEQELYRVAQEALNNVLKHSHAARVTMRAAVMNGTATLEIADDGVGFEPALRAGDGFGLPGMRERVERLGGRFSIESSPGAGTRVRVEVAV